MKRSLFDQAAAAGIVRRFEQLSPSSHGLWGKMQVTEMLLHCELANTYIVEDKSLYRRPGLKKRLLTFAALHLISKFPHNRKGPERLYTRGRIDPAEFEKQQKASIKSITRLANHKEPITSLHAGLGFLSRREWGIISWMHMDHHLRQFGV
jgi:Protein of unknown function (DUF1569)